jgi:trk system potassium uptake protein TrkA
MFNASWGVDVSVSTPHLLTALVEEAVTVGSLVRIMTFENDAARLSEIRLAESSPANGVSIANLGLPRESTIVAVVREGKVIFPRGDVTLGAGDEVLVLAVAECEDAVRKVLVG